MFLNSNQTCIWSVKLINFQPFEPQVNINRNQITSLIMLANKLQKLKQELQKMSSDNYCPTAPPTTGTTTCFLKTMSQPRRLLRTIEMIPSLHVLRFFVSFLFHINFLPLSGAHDWSILLAICVRYISSYCRVNIVMKHKCEGLCSLGSLGSYNQL